MKVIQKPVGFGLPGEPVERRLVFNTQEKAILQKAADIAEKACDLVTYDENNPHTEAAILHLGLGLIEGEIKDLLGEGESIRIEWVE